MKISVSNLINVVLILLVVGVCLFYQSEINKRNKIIFNKNTEINNQKTILNLKDTLSLLQFQLENFPIQDYLLSFVKSDAKINESLAILPKFVFCHSEVDCNSCVEELISVMNEFKDRIHEENIIYLAQYENERDIHMFKRINKINSLILNVECHSLLQKQIKMPFCFVIDENGSVDCVYFPSIDNVSMINKYMEHIAKKYFNSTKD